MVTAITFTPSQMLSLNDSLKLSEQSIIKTKEAAENGMNFLSSWHIVNLISQNSLVENIEKF